MTEGEFQRWAEARLSERGLRWHHCPDSRRCRGTAGMPDILIAGPGGVGAVELKVGMNDLSSAQTRWRYGFIAGGVEWLTAWPNDRDRIEDMLDRLNTRRIA